MSTIAWKFEGNYGSTVWDGDYEMYLSDGLYLGFV